jgi:hypothetical protein
MFTQHNKLISVVPICLLSFFLSQASEACSQTWCDQLSINTGDGNLVGRPIWAKCPKCNRQFVLSDAPLVEARTDINTLRHFHVVNCPYCGFPLIKVTVCYAKSSADIAPGTCFIATAAYGNPSAAEVEILRHFRDMYLLSNPLTYNLVVLYYIISPPIAQAIAKSELLRAITRIHLTPVVITIYPFVIIPEVANCIKNGNANEKK